MKKNLLSLLLTLVLVLPCLSITAAADEATPNWAGDDGIIKVLAIGNSYTKDSFYYFDQVETAQDPDDNVKMVVGYLYQGGQPISVHASNAVNSEPSYIYYKYDRTVAKSWKETPNATTLTGLLDEDWDMISIQLSPTTAPGTEGLDTLINFIKEHKTNPNAKIGCHFTWAFAKPYQYTGPYKDTFVSKFQGDNTAQFEYMTQTAQQVLTEYPDLQFLVPAGTALQNIRTGIMGDNLQRDNYHLNPFGRTMVSYTWYSFLTGTLDSIKLTKTSSWNPSQYERNVLIEAINNAIANPFAVTPSTVTEPDPRPVYYTLEPRADQGGGEIKAYDVNDPTQIVTVQYTGRKNTARAHTFCRLNDDGVLDAQLIFAWQPTVAYHNYYQGYDAATNTMILADGTAAMGGHTGAASCGITCTPSTSSGGRELSYYVMGIPTTTPVVDVTGEDHGLKTLQDIIDLSATHRIRMNHYSYDNSVPKALFVDEVVKLEVPAYDLKDGDVVFIPGAASVGAVCDAYIMKSATAAVGDKVAVTIPSNAPKATGNKGNTTGRFWQMMGEELKIINGMWYSHNKQGDPALTSYQYGYHDNLVDYGGDYITLEQHADHLGGKAKCGQGFTQACGTNDSRGRECAGKLTVTQDLKIIDLRAEVQAGLVAPVSTKIDVMHLCEANEAVVNTFVPDGTKETGTAVALIVIDNHGTMTRGEVIQAIYDKAGRPESTKDISFADVPADNVYYNAIRWAAGKKYIAGYGDGTFGVNDKITVEQLSVILWNYMGHPEDDALLDQIGEHSRWALNSLHWSVARKVITSIPYDTVGDAAARVQTVRVLADYLK